MHRYSKHKQHTKFIDMKLIDSAVRLIDSHFGIN